MVDLAFLHSMFLDEVIIALALGALVGIERERVPEKKYAGVRTLSVLCGGGPIAAQISEVTGSVLPVAIYMILGATFALLVIYIRRTAGQDDLGLTTSSTVFLMTLIGVLLGYGFMQEAVATTLIAVFLLTEKDFFSKYTERLSAAELSDAVKLGILALVLYPILPSGPVGPYGVLYLQKALLFMIFVLLVQFVAFVSLEYWKTRISFIASAALGGVASSLAVVATMIQYVKEEKLGEAAYVASTVTVVAMVLRNAAIAVSLAPRLVHELLVPFGAAAVIGLVFALFYYRRGGTFDAIDFGAESPFSFRSAFTFGVYYLGILLVTEVSKGYFADAGIYLTAFIGGIGSSTAVVASAVTLLSSSGTITVSQAATMVAFGAISSLLSKLVYTELGGARQLTKYLLLPYILMSLALLSVLL